MLPLNQLENAEKIKKLLLEQIFSTVRWRESINSDVKKNYSIILLKFLSGKVLTGMVKKNNKKFNCFSINSITDIKNLPNEFKK